jgi:hypothetical protein
MRKVQLYINDQRVDLFDDENISLTQTIKNIQDVSKIFTDFSKSFTVPASKNNNKIFEHYYNFHIFDGFDSRIKAPAKIDINDVPFRYGRVRLDGVEMRSGKAYSYKITFYGNTVVLKDLMGEENLGALSTLDAFNQTYDASNIEAALKADPSTAHIVAPLITHSQRLYYDSNEDILNTGNLHKGTNQHGVYWKELKYAIRVHKIVEAIEERYGFTFSDDFFSTTNLPYYNLFMWLHRNKGPVTSIDQDQTYTKQITGWTTTQGSNSFVTSNAVYLQDASTITNFRFDLDVSGAITSPYSISITRNNVEIFSQSGIVSANYEVDLLYAAQSGASYQVTISYSDAITFADAIWTVVSGVNQDQYSTGSFSAPASFEFVITDQIPEIKVIDFLSGLFKMFNLVAEVGNDNVITVKTLDNYYDEGNLINLTSYIHSESHSVDSTIPYREISFAYEDTESFLAANHNNLVGSEWAKESYNGEEQGIKEGEKFDVVVPFAHFKYENLIDTFGADTVEVQWGYAVDDNEDPYIGKPLLFYPVLQSQSGIAFVTEANAEGSFSITIEITSPIVMPSNSLYFNPATGTDNINFKYEKNEYTRDLSFPGTLFNNYYFDYISALFNRQRRLSKFKAQLPVSFLLNYSLGDTILISDREYHINSITTDLTTGNSDLELLNLVEGFLEIPENGNGGGEDPGTVTVSVSGQTSPLESTQYSYNVTVGGTAQGTETYQWSVSNGVIDSGSTSSNVLITWNEVSSNSPGSVTCTVTKGSLAPVADTLNVTIQDVAEPTFTVDITGVNSPYTEGDTDTYGLTIVGDTTNVTYNWSVSGGTITSGQGTSSIGVTWDTPTTNGSVQVNAFRNGTEFLASDSESVVVNAAAAPTFGIDITNVSSPVLEEDVVTYGTTLSGTASGTVTYSWTVVGGSFTGQGTSSITVTWDTPGSGSVRVDAVREGVGASDEDAVSVTALETTVVITGDFTDIQRYLSRTYGSSVGGNTVGTITYSWSVSGGTINSGQGTSSVNVTWDTVGTGTLSLTATRQSRSGFDSGSLTVLPLYYRFERCSDGLLVWQNLASEPALDDLYTDGVNEFVYIGPPTSYPGTIVTNLSGPIGSGCTPPPPDPSTISITGDQDIDTAGQSGVTYTITTDPQSVIWLLSDTNLPQYNPIPLTITTSTSGTGNGTFDVTFGAYNGDGTETLRSVITATEQNPTNPNPAASGSIVISQSPPPPTTYYIFDPCDVADSTVMAEFASAPATNERAVGGFSNYYTYSGTTTTNSSLHPIATLTLEGVTGCPPAPSCTRYQALNEGGSSSTFGYNDCTSGAFRTFTLQPNESRDVCAENGTFGYESGDTNYTITELGSC